MTTTIQHRMVESSFVSFTDDSHTLLLCCCNSKYLYSSWWCEYDKRWFNAIWSGLWNAASASFKPRLRQLAFMVGIDEFAAFSTIPVLNCR